MTLRGVFHKRSILGGINSSNKADGPIDRIVSSKKRVKSKVSLPGMSKNGPKLLSKAVELTALDARGAMPPYRFIMKYQDHT